MLQWGAGGSGTILRCQSLLSIPRIVGLWHGAGMTLYRLPLLVWALCFESILLIGSLPVFAAGLTMLLTEPNFNTSSFLPAGAAVVLH